MSSGGKAAEQVVRESVDEAKQGVAATGQDIQKDIQSDSLAHGLSHATGVSPGAIEELQHGDITGAVGAEVDHFHRDLDALQAQAPDDPGTLTTDLNVRLPNPDPKTQALLSTNPITAPYGAMLGLVAGDKQDRKRRAEKYRKYITDPAGDIASFMGVAMSGSDSSGARSMAVGMRTAGAWNQVKQGEFGNAVDALGGERKAFDNEALAAGAATDGTPRGRMVEGFTESLLGLGNIPQMAVGLENTAGYVAAGGEAVWEGRGLEFLRHSAGQGAVMGEQMVNAVMENPWHTLGSLGADAALAAVTGGGSVAGRAGKTARMAGRGPDVDAPDANVPDRSLHSRDGDGSTGGNNRVAADGGGQVQTLRRVVADSDSDLDPEDIRPENYDKVAREIDPSDYDGETQKIRNEFDSIAPDLTNLPGVSQNDIDWIENQMSKHGSELYDSHWQLEHDLRRLATADDGDPIEDLGEIISQREPNKEGLEHLSAHTNGAIRLLENSRKELDPNDTLDINKNRGDLRYALRAVSVGDIPGVKSNVIWLERGNSSAGFKHILKRHGKADEFYAMPNIDTPENIKDLIAEAIETGTPHRIPEDDDGGAAFEYDTESGDSVTVIVANNGFIVTARPGEY